MKNWKLTVCEALTERFVNLASLESSPLFQSIYLDALTDVVADRNRLRHADRSRNAPRAVICPAPDCCTRSV